MSEARKRAGGTDGGKKGIRAVVDRIEGDRAVCEGADRTMFTIPLGRFAQRPKEGDVIWWENGQARRLEEETEQRKEEALQFFQRLCKKR